MEQTIIAALVTGFVAFFTGWLLRSTQSKPSYSRSETDDRRLSDKVFIEGIAGRLFQAEGLVTDHGLQLATLKERLTAMDGKMDLLLGMMSKRKG